MSNSSSLWPHRAATTVALLFQTSTFSPGFCLAHLNLVPRGYIATSWSSGLQKNNARWDFFCFALTSLLE